MLKFLQPNVSPVGGYTFIDPDTGFRYGPHKDFATLDKHVNTYRSQNKLEPIEKFRAVWEHYVCMNVPSMQLKCCPVAEKVKRNFEQYYSGAKAYVKSMMMGTSAFVDKEEAEARASVCVNCTSNVKNIGHSHSQFYTDGFMRAQVGTRSTSHDKKLFTCRECTCLNRAKVHYNPEVVAENLSPRDIANMKTKPRDIRTGQRLRCWQLDAIEQANKE